MAFDHSLVPGPRANLTRYHGVPAPDCKLRKAIVPTRNAVRGTPRTHQRRSDSDTPDDFHTPAAKPHSDLQAPLSWAQRLKRVFLIDRAAFGSAGVLTAAESCA